MDAKEAIVYMKKARSLHIERYGDNKKICLYDMAISALEKVETLEAENARLRERETPKEPTDKRYWHGGLLGAKCPNCQKIIGGYEKFCPNCSQAIKIDKE